MGKRGRPPLFERLQAGLEDVLRHERGEIELRETRVSIPDPPRAYSSDEVHRIRERLQLSQASFASLLCVSNKTVQGWEQGLRVPSHAAARLLQFVENPRLLLHAVLPADD